MTEQEKEAVRLRLVALGVNADVATSQASSAGEQAFAKGINLQTLLLFALTVASGCRSGLTPELAKEVEYLHQKVDVETDLELNEARN